MSILFNELQGTIARIEQTQRTEIERAKQKAMQDIVIPFNTEIDTARTKAIAEITDKANAEIAQIRQEADARVSAVQQNLAEQKAQLCEAGEKKKNENTELALAMVEEDVTKKYKGVLEGLRGMADGVKE